MNQIEKTLVFRGKPISKDNRRFPARNRRTGASVIVIPKSYKDWERDKRAEAAIQVRGDDRFPILKPIKILIGPVIFAYPYAPTQVDVFNAPKSICDAMGPERLSKTKRLPAGVRRAGPIYEDDSQIFIGGPLYKIKTTGEPAIIVGLRTVTDDEFNERVKQAMEALGYVLPYQE